MGVYFSRRQAIRIFGAGAFGAGAMARLASRLFAEELSVTPQMTEGPFYPNRLPLDTDNDLLIINDSITPAVGEITHLTGRVLSSAGEPVRNASVEIWQVDGNGVYLHSGSANRGGADQHFQGFGRFLTDAEGRYYFRTVKPVPYPGRPAPHIHVAVNQNGRRIYTTQLFVQGHPGNQRDGVLRGLRDPRARDAVMVDFRPIVQSRREELVAHFEIVMGHTPEDRDHDDDRG